MLTKKLPNELVISILFIWIKTYIVYKFVFKLPTDSWYEEFILLINPLSSALFCLGISFLFTKVNKKKILLGIYGILSFVLYANILYYRFFSDFITIPVLFQTNNVSDIGNSVIEQIYWYDWFFFIDIMILFIILTYGPNITSQITRTDKRKIMLSALSLLLINVLLAEIARPQLLTRTFDRELLVKNLGTYNYHIYDLILQSKTTAQKAFADSVDVEEVKEYLKQKDTETSTKMFGIAKGKNIIMISLESTQNFVINKEINGEEITPFLNSLIEDSFYFDNFYHQVGQGKTSDSEFLTENSLYPLPRGAVFQTHPLNEYNATPEIVKEYGYYSAVFHGNNKSFWNRDIMYDSFGYDKFFSEEYYDITEENQINYGLKDIPFFEQSMNYLTELPQPFYTKFITLTNHHPFLYAKDDMLFETEPEDSMINRYLVTIRYMDEAIKQFFQMLRSSGLYENSVVIIYGDHYGISKWHNDELAGFFNKEEITSYDHVQLQKVPLIIHIPNEEGRTISTVSGQIDLKPTILNLLGITNHSIQFGTDLFAMNRDEFTVLRDQSFISDKYIYTDNTCYDRQSGEKLRTKKCNDDIQKANDELQASDDIIYGDLLRFLQDK